MLRYTVGYAWSISSSFTRSACIFSVVLGRDLGLSSLLATGKPEGLELCLRLARKVLHLKSTNGQGASGCKKNFVQCRALRVPFGFFISRAVAFSSDNHSTLAPPDGNVRSGVNTPARVGRSLQWPPMAPCRWRTSLRNGHGWLNSVGVRGRGDQNTEGRGFLQAPLPLPTAFQRNVVQ